MGLYNVVGPCVVGKLHYVRPTTQPIEVDDDTAAPLVESGNLEPYGTTYVDYIESVRVEGDTGDVLDGIVRTEPDLTGDVATETPPAPRPRARRRTDED